MDLFWLIVNNILQLAVGYFFYKIECAFLQPRKGRLAFFLAWIGISAAATIAVFPGDPVNITVGLLILTAVNFLLFEGKWFVKLSALTVLYPMAMSLNYLHLDVGVKLWHLLKPGQPEFMGDSYAVASYGLVVLFWYLFYRLLRDSLVKIHRILTAKAWLTINVVCLASFVAVFSCTFFAPEPTYVMWPCLIACIITNIGSIRLAAAYLADGIYADMERKNLQMQQNYYQELENNQRQVRKLRHDLNNQLMVVGGLLEDGKRDEAEKYFFQLSGKVLKSSRVFCKNSVVNALLNAKYDLMEETEADIFFNISIDGMMMIDDVSLCTIFANTMDNAVEACRKIKDPAKRWIHLRARYAENGYFSYEIANSKENEVKMKRERFITDKADPAFHGVGISSVKEIVEKYGGTIDISFTDNEFKVVILIG